MSVRCAGTMRARTWCARRVSTLRSRAGFPPRIPPAETRRRTHRVPRVERFQDRHLRGRCRAKNDAQKRVSVRLRGPRPPYARAIDRSSFLSHEVGQPHDLIGQRLRGGAVVVGGGSTPPSGGAGLVRVEGPHRLRRRVQRRVVPPPDRPRIHVVELGDDPVMPPVGLFFFSPGFDMGDRVRVWHRRRRDIVWHNRCIPRLNVSVRCWRAGGRRRRNEHSPIAADLQLVGDDVGPSHARRGEAVPHDGRAPPRRSEVPAGLPDLPYARVRQGRLPVRPFRVSKRCFGARACFRPTDGTRVDRERRTFALEWREEPRSTLDAARPPYYARPALRLSRPAWHCPQFKRLQFLSRLGRTDG